MKNNFNILREEAGAIGRVAKLEETCGKLAGALDFTTAVLQKLAEDGSELAKAALESLKEQAKKEDK